MFYTFFTTSSLSLTLGSKVIHDQVKEVEKYLLNGFEIQGPGVFGFFGNTFLRLLENL